MAKARSKVRRLPTPVDGQPNLAPKPTETKAVPGEQLTLIRELNFMEMSACEKALDENARANQMIQQGQQLAQQAGARFTECLKLMGLPTDKPDGTPMEYRPEGQKLYRVDRAPTPKDLPATETEPAPTPVDDQTRTLKALEAAAAVVDAMDPLPEPTPINGKVVDLVEV